MKRIIFHTILIITALVTSCRKVELEPVDGEPVFTAEAQFNDSPKVLMAGVDDFYMFSSFEKDEYDVHSFSGTFAIKDNIERKESLAFHFRDFQLWPQGQPSILEALGQEFEYADRSEGQPSIITTIVWNGEFNASESILPNATAVLYEWDFGDQNSVVDSFYPLSSHVYENIPQGLPVTLTVRAQDNSCSGFMTRNVPAGLNAQCDLDLDISFNAGIGNALNITAIPTGASPFNYLWSDGSIQDSIYIDSIIIGQNSASVTVTDNNGCTISAGITTDFTPGTSPKICVAKFNYNIVEDSVQDTIIIPVDSLQFSKITIVYYDIEGFEYRSDLKKQESTASINILDVDDYDNNEKGEKTKKLTLQFSCRLWNEFGEFIDVTGGKAVIAVAYP